MEPQTITRSPRLPHPCYHIQPPTHCFSNIPPFQVLFHYTIQPPWIICLSGTNAKWYVSLLLSVCPSCPDPPPLPPISHQRPSTSMGVSFFFGWWSSILPMHVNETTIRLLYGVAIYPLFSRRLDYFRFNWSEEIGVSGNRNVNIAGQFGSGPHLP